MDILCGTIMVMAVRDPEVQMKRLMARDLFLTEMDAKNRVLSQGDVREKAKRCEQRGEGKGVVIWNDGTEEELRTEVARVMAMIKRSCPKGWTWLLLLCPPVAGIGAS